MTLMLLESTNTPLPTVPLVVPTMVQSNKPMLPVQVVNLSQEDL